MPRKSKSKGSKKKHDGFFRQIRMALSRLHPSDHAFVLYSAIDDEESLRSWKRKSRDAFVSALLNGSRGTLDTHLTFLKPEQCDSFQTGVERHAKKVYRDDRPYLKRTKMVSLEDFYNQPGASVADWARDAKLNESMPQILAEIMPCLTEEDQEIFNLKRDGKLESEIAATLGISVRTVARRIAGLKIKLGREAHRRMNDV